MKRSALKKGIILTLIGVLAFAVMGAGARECFCSEAVPAKAKTEIPSATCPMTGGCENTPALPSSDQSCPCRNNSCTFFLEEKKPDLFLARTDGSPIRGDSGPVVSKVPLSTDQGQLFGLSVEQLFLYRHLQNLRC